MSSIQNETATQIADRMHAWKEAFERKDVDAMMTFYEEDDAFTAFDLMPPLQFHGGAMWRENWVHFFGQWEGSPGLEFADMRIQGSDDLAVVRLLVRLTGVMNGASLDLWVRQTNCFNRADGQWVMFHDHVSVPTDFATGSSLLDLLPAESGIVQR